jgi:valyl-tRNA synthetase
MADEYDAKAVEQKWQDWWESEKIYHFDHNSAKPVYSIDNPPRYASGPLHVGHAVHYTHIDFAARYKRQRGHNVFFPLCFDVNGMPIEVNVEKKYNIKMIDVDRHEFIKLCSEFAENNIKEMTNQFKILGESMDPSIYYQTDAKYYRKLTQISFIRLFHKGLVYKGERPINWCPRCGTALADAEVEHRTRMTKLNYIYFTMSDTGERVLIATTRPEMLATCHIVAIHPDDSRSDNFAGKMIKTPLYNKEVRLVPDEKVDPGFGTGIVMVCSIGDKDDIEWINRYDIQVEKSLDEHGKMTEVTGKYQGMDVPTAREAILTDLKSEGLLDKQEDLEQSVGTCWRCQSPIEFLVKPQWFLNVLDFKSDVLKASDEINWYPEFMKVRLEEWVNSLSWDWVISRQRYFSTPIPVWECEECGSAVSAKEEDCYVDPTIDKPPVDKCSKCGSSKLIGSEEVFDTWMDSSISPLFNTFWLRDDEKFGKYYPMSLRPQSHDIIRTWAFYTIVRGLLLTGQKPFENIMMGGFILATDGTPMHASKGNVIDPLEILKDYGADAIRYYAASCALGKDNAFRWKDVKEGVRFARKLWNLERLISKALPTDKSDLEGFKPEMLSLIDKWILARYNQVLTESTTAMDNYQFDKARKAVVNFMWHELADHYIEAVKYRLYKGDDLGVRYTLYHVGLGILKILAPILPHVTEELYQECYKDLEGVKSLHITDWPETVYDEAGAIEKGEIVIDIIAALRRWKSESGIPLNREIDRIEIIAGPHEEILTTGMADIKETTRVKSIEFSSDTDLTEQIVNVKPIHSKFGPKYRGDAPAVIEHLNSIKPDDLKNTFSEEEYKFKLASGKEISVSIDDLDLEKELFSHGKKVTTLQVSDIIILIPT